MDPRLLVQPHLEDVPQAAVLLAAALQEGETFDIPCHIQRHIIVGLLLFSVEQEKRDCPVNLTKLLISYSTAEIMLQLIIYNFIIK